MRAAVIKVHQANSLRLTEIPNPSPEENQVRYMNKILELVGPTTLEESMKFLSYHGIICSTGILGHKAFLENFDPIKSIPNAVYLCSFFRNFPTQETIDKLFAHIRQHNLKPIIGKVFPFEEIADAHLLMEQSAANGKVVVVVSE